MLLISAICVSLVTAVWLLALLWRRETPKHMVRGFVATLIDICWFNVYVWLCPLSITAYMISSTILFYLEQITGIHRVLHWLVRPLYYPICFVMLVAELAMMKTLNLYFNLAWSMRATCQSHEIAVQYCSIM